MKDREHTSYWTWAGMKARCTNPKHSMYRYYGARGIAVCDRWESFKGFLADMGERPDGHTLDRIDNDKGYSPENCRWASHKDQRQKQPRTKFYTYKGKTLCLTDWIREITNCANDREAHQLLNNAKPRKANG